MIVNNWWWRSVRIDRSFHISSYFEVVRSTAAQYIYGAGGGGDTLNDAQCVRHTVVVLHLHRVKVTRRIVVVSHRSSMLLDTV